MQVRLPVADPTQAAAAVCPTFVPRIWQIVPHARSLREKRAGYWEVRIDAGVDRLTGKRVEVSRSVSGSRRDAERVLSTLISKHETASVGGSTTATFGALLAAWLEQVEPDLAYQTVQGYKRLIRNHIEPALGSIKLRKLDVATLDSFYPRAYGRRALRRRRFGRRTLLFVRR